MSDTKKELMNVWVEKYRPNEIKEIVYSTDTIKLVFKKIIETKSLPHLLLSGPPGVGKTSTIISVAKELFGDMYEDRVTLVNASEDRGIDYVRDTIIHLATSYTYYDDEVLPYKLIILDEADAMTKEAQCALKRLIETSSGSTRFCFICNYKSKIIHPIESRCMHIEFPPITEEKGINKLLKIAKKENIQVDKKYLKTIMNKSKGDMRKAITLLQNLSYLYRGSKISEKVEVNFSNVKKVCELLDDNEIEKLLITCSNKKLSSKDLILLAEDFVCNSYSSSSIITELVDYIIESNNYSDLVKVKLLILMGDSYATTTIGSSEYMCFINMFSSINKILCE